MTECATCGKPADETKMTIHGGNARVTVGIHADLSDGIVLCRLCLFGVLSRIALNLLNEALDEFNRVESQNHVRRN